jgi:hypothetical protein
MLTDMTAEEIRAHWVQKFHRAADDLRAHFQPGKGD